MQKQTWFAASMTIVGTLCSLMYYFQGYEILHTRSAWTVSLLDAIGLPKPYYVAKTAL